MNTEYGLTAKRYIADIENALEKACDTYLQKDSEIANAVRYSLLNGGKRVRGTLVLAFSELENGNYHTALQYASAIEMVHAYSLIHDDLPCMDDDDLRRGKPSCHIQFGEAVALLAGDALLTMAFECIADAENENSFLSLAVKSLSKAAGAKGMIYGQELDLAYENQKASEEILLSIHSSKTGALIKASMELGFYSAQKTPSKPAYYCIDKIGIIFQMVDDLLDASKTTEELGKPAKSDEKNQKSTFITLLGEEKTIQQVSELTKTAVRCMENEYGTKASFLCEFAKELSIRSK